MILQGYPFVLQTLNAIFFDAGVLICFFEDALLFHGCQMFLLFLKCSMLSLKLMFCFLRMSDTILV